MIRGKRVKWFSDSQSCVNIVQCGSSKKELQFEALSIFNLCLEFNIDLSIQWIPRELNDIADNISKFSNTDEWEVSSSFFEQIDNIWGPHDVDRFAS